MEIQKISIWDIVPYENNPRLNDDAVEAVAESIKQTGYNAPIIVDEDYVVLAGHTRLKALKRLGYDEAEVVVREGLTDDQKKKFRILDNKDGEIAEWDFDALAEELEGLDFEGFDFGFDMPEPETEETTETEKAPSLKERYACVPFTVLNTRDGDWVQRKKAWMALGIRSEEGRGDDLCYRVGLYDYK